MNKVTKIEKAQPRRNLIMNALEDHLGGKYYASIPLMLMIDGFVNDFEQKVFC